METNRIENGALSASVSVEDVRGGLVAAFRRLEEMAFEHTRNGYRFRDYILGLRADVLEYPAQAMQWPEAGQPIDVANPAVFRAADPTPTPPPTDEERRQLRAAVAVLRDRDRGRVNVPDPAPPMEWRVRTNEPTMPTHANTEPILERTEIFPELDPPPAPPPVEVHQRPTQATNVRQFARVERHNMEPNTDEGADSIASRIFEWLVQTGERDTVRRNAWDYWPTLTSMQRELVTRAANTQLGIRLSVGQAEDISRRLDSTLNFARGVERTMGREVAQRRQMTGAVATAGPAWFRGPNEDMRAEYQRLYQNMTLQAQAAGAARPEANLQTPAPTWAEQVADAARAEITRIQWVDMADPIPPEPQGG